MFGTDIHIRTTRGYAICLARASAQISMDSGGSERLAEEVKSTFGNSS
jgi:hypothetical protein